MTGPLGALLDLVLPGSCAGCGCADSGREDLCSTCSAPLRAAPVLRRPSPVPPGLPPVLAPAAYDGPVRAAMLAHKEQGRLRLARPLGDALASAAGVTLETLSGHGPTLLVPVPSGRSARRERGYDHALRLARRAAWTLRRQGFDVEVAAVLRQVRPVGDQAGMGAAGRAANLAGALAVRPRCAPALGGRSALLLDDVMTTGSTLAEAARALRSAGASVPAAGVVAATTLRSAGRGQSTVRVTGFPTPCESG